MFLAILILLGKAALFGVVGVILNEIMWKLA